HVPGSRRVGKAGAPVASGNSSRCWRAPPLPLASPGSSSKPTTIPIKRRRTAPPWAPSSSCTGSWAGLSSSIHSRRIQDKPLEIIEFTIPSVLKIVALVVFAQTVFTRAVDPVTPMIAEDLAIAVKTAALSSAYTFPYALVQPALGVTGDFLGKTRLMNFCVQ